jgi:hypothetical protein
VGPEHHHPNVYVCLVGPTAGGRKGSAIAAAEKFFTVGTSAPSLPQIVPGISTAEGVIWKVRDAVTKREFNKRDNCFQDVPIQEAVIDRRILFKLTEFQQALANMRKRDSSLSAILRQGWDGTTLDTPSKTSPTKATDAHVSLVAAITKHELLFETNAVDAHNGLLNRFLFCCCQRAHLLPEGEMPRGFYLVQVGHRTRKQSGRRAGQVARGERESQTRMAAWKPWLCAAHGQRRGQCREWVDSESLCGRNGESRMEMIEQCITIPILAKRLSMSRQRTRQLIMNEPGILRFEGTHKTTYRIPESVAARIVRRATVLAPSHPK